MRCLTSSLILLGVFTVACEATDVSRPSSSDDDNTPNQNGADSGSTIGNGDPSTMNGADAGGGSDDPGTMTTGGDVSGTWCGGVEVAGPVTVPLGQTLEVCAGAIVNVAPGAQNGITVKGTLKLNGSASNRAVMRSTGRWQGIIVSGTLEGTGLDISGAGICLDGQAGSTITLDEAVMADCTQSMRLKNGGTFTHTQIIGGRTVEITGGMLRMTDSVIDFRHPTLPPDCTDWAGGGAELDHVRFTGCHCPLHFNSATMPVTVTNSIFDEAGNSVMIAHSNATFTGNNFISTSYPMLDIGGAIQANIAGNYWGGEAPRLGTQNVAQFTGAAEFATTPIEGAGPR